MAKKRLIGIIVIKDNIAVQSIGYKKYLPIGNPLYSIENLSWWGVDEIIILDINRSKFQQGPNFELLEKINNLNITTPLIYSGNIRNENDAKNVIKLGVERICFDNLLFKNFKLIEKISNEIGSQAIIINLPIVLKNNHLFVYNHVTKKILPLEDHNIFKIKLSCYSEILIIDYENEGKYGMFNLGLLKNLKLKKDLILFGGLDETNKIKKLLKLNKVKGICIGNRLYFREHAYHNIKKEINSSKLRSYTYND